MVVYKKIQDSRIARLLALLCAVTYSGAYLTRVNFAAVTVAIIGDMGWEKSAISAVTTALFISYGVGQLVSGWLGDRFRPEHIMAAGLGASICMNLLIPFCTSITQMTIIWAVNGLSQAMLWPPISRITAGYCRAGDFQVATVITSWGSSVGTLLVYLISSFCISVSGWRTVFYICAGIAFVILICFVIIFPRFARYADEYGVEEIIEGATTNDDHKSRTNMPAIVYILLSVIMLAVVLLGALRDSITAWLPNYISEVFSYGAGSAVLTGAIIPILTTLIYPIVLAYYRRFFTSEVTCAATIYAMSGVSALILFFIHDSSPILSVVLLALICADMHAANFLMIGLIPKRFDRYGNVAMISGVINASVYVGSSISIWGIASIAENYGWQYTIAVWCIAGFAAMALCLSIIRPWARTFGKAKK